MDIKSIQEVLKEKHLYHGRIDGIAGPMTRAAVIKGLKSYMPGDQAWAKWPAVRQRVAFMQLHFDSLDIDSGPIDGWIGPQTLHAFEEWQHIQRTGKRPELWRDDVPDDPAPTDPQVWPRYKDLRKFYGVPGTNLTRLILPYPMKIAWNLNQSITGFSIHEKCHDSALRVFSKINGHYSPEDIAKHGFDLFAGCLSSPPRKMRGGSNWSTHSWAIAIDFDSLRNQFKWGRDRAYLDHPDCEQFWEFWEAEGWLSLGRARNFDWMHVQAARL